MGKHGPCYHCGVTSTPLWRNGPPEKPVLCNACGSRWRTKGSLINYTPMHSRPEGDDLIIPKVSKIKTNYAHKNKEAKLLKRKQNHENDENGVRGIHYRKIKDEQSSTISSSGSVISNSESYTQFRVVDASEDLSQSVVWDTFVPPQKKTCVSHSNQSSSVQKLTKDLYAILHEQQSSYAPESPENDLLIESEIVNGTVKHPSPLILEEESEASSITIENKLVLLANDEFSREMPQKQIKMDKSQVENVQILESCNSRLRNVDLKDVVNFEEFMRNMTMNEQRELVKFLPLADITKYPENLKGMFDSNQFKESLISFQHLLGEGVFDKSLVGSKDEDCEALKKLALFDLSKSQWIECYNLLKRCENSSTTRNMERGLNVMNSSTFVDMKRPSDGQYQNISEISTTMVTPKLANMYTNDGSKEATYNSNSLIPDSFHYSYETFDEDLLLDVPFSHSFPQAELLSQT